MTSDVVLDAWALMAIVRREQPAMGRVYDVLRNAEAGSIVVAMSIVNVGEVYYHVARSFDAAAADQLLTYIRRLALTILPATDARVMAAARIKAAHRLSYADAFAVAATQERHATLWTGDPELVALTDVFPIEVLTRA